MDSIDPLLPLMATGCSPSFHTIDQHVNDLLLSGTDRIDGAVAPRPMEDWAEISASESVMNEKHPSTVNPPVDAMQWESVVDLETKEVLGRLVSYEDAADAGVELTLEESLAWAFAHGREYRFAEEDYLLTCLTLILELHLWTPQIADTVALQYSHQDGESDFLQSAEAVVNTLSASQRLPWGGEITASYVAVIRARGARGRLGIHLVPRQRVSVSSPSVEASHCSAAPG